MYIREGAITLSDSTRAYQEERQISDSIEGSSSVFNEHLDRTTTEAVRAGLEALWNKQGSLGSESIDLVAAVPEKLKQIISQGGPEFGLLFQLLVLEVTTKTDLYALLESSKSAQRLIESVCRSGGLRVKHDMNNSVFQKVTASILLPDCRTSCQLSFSPARRVSTSQLRRWTHKWYIIPWVEALSAKAGTVDKYNADGYLAREIMSTGLSLATFLDYFHPNPMVFSAGVERLVRDLWSSSPLSKSTRRRGGPATRKTCPSWGSAAGPRPPSVKS